MFFSSSAFAIGVDSNVERHLNKTDREENPKEITFVKQDYKFNESINYNSLGRCVILVRNYDQYGNYTHTDIYEYDVSSYSTCKLIASIWGQEQ